MAPTVGLYQTLGGLTGAFNTAADVTITATFNEASPKTFIGKQFMVELMQ